MKKISTLLASLILTISVFAAAKPKSTLTIQSVSQSNLKVVVDGRRFEPADNYVSIQGLEAGNHQVKIYQEKNTGLFFIFGKKYEVVYNGTIGVKPRANTMISIDRFGKATISDTRSTAGGYGRGGRDFDFSRGNQSGDYSNDRGGQWGGYDNHSGYDAGMDAREFDAVLQSIDKEWLESNKLKSATQIVKNNSLTTAQVKELVMMFSFESNKLDLAKQAYANTVDKRNYSLINDAFNFSSSKDDLARFIRSAR